MKNNIFIKIIFAVLLAFIVNSFVYFSFGNIYSSKILDYKDFSQQFNNGIYQYRILSSYFLIWVYEFLGSLNLDYSHFKLKFFSVSSEPQMFLAFYLLNTAFLVLCALMLVLITETKNFAATNSEKILITSVAIFTMALSQFVILPYDCSSYFTLLFFYFILLKFLNQNSKFSLFLLVIILTVSTLNRESAAISVSLAATLLLDKFKIGKQSLFPLIILAITFVAVYLGLRLFNKSFTTNDGNLLITNFTEPKNYLGILFWLVFLVFSLLLSKTNKAFQNILVFHIFSLPYIFMCFYSGILYEIRLYIPLFLTSILLSQTKITFSDW